MIRTSGLHISLKFVSLIQNICQEMTAGERNREKGGYSCNYVIEGPFHSVLFRVFYYDVEMSFLKKKTPGFYGMLC